jgi:transposase
MRKRKIDDLEQKKAALREEFEKNDGAKYYLRVLYVYLVLSGFPVSKLPGGISPKTIDRWVRRYTELGLDALRSAPIPGRPAGLDAGRLEEVRRAVLESPGKAGYAQAGWDGKLLSRLISDRYGIAIKVRMCQYLLGKMGLTLQRGRLKPHKADAAAQADFLK